MTTFFEHQKSSYKKNYLRNLISLASADGVLDDNERILIMKIGQNHGLKDWQIEQLLEENYSNYEIFLPEIMANRMELLYDFMQMIYADGLVNVSEVEFIRGVVQKFHLRREIVDHLIDLFQYGAPSSAEWRDFVDYINEVFVN